MALRMVRIYLVLQNKRFVREPFAALDTGPYCAARHPPFDMNFRAHREQITCTKCPRATTKQSNNVVELMRLHPHQQSVARNALFLRKNSPHLLAIGRQLRDKEGQRNRAGELDGLVDNDAVACEVASCGQNPRRRSCGLESGATMPSCADLGLEWQKVGA